MILIVTHKQDYTADFLIDKLNKRKIAYRRLNCEDLFTTQYKISYNNGFSLCLLEQTNYKSVWFRRTMLPAFKGLSFGEQQFLLNEAEKFLQNLFSVIDADWLSNPFEVYKAENKLLQLKLAHKIGFTIPRTLVSNSKQDILDFYTDSSFNLIIKPISQSRIIESDRTSFIFTNLVSKEVIENIDSFDITPCIIQEYINKFLEIRVTVVGELVFAASVDSQSDNDAKIDWRKKKLEFKSYTLPERIAQLCVAIVAELNLSFGAIDLILTPEGNFVFLEVNPNGQWAWIEHETGMPISDSIIDLLLR